MAETVPAAAAERHEHDLREGTGVHVPYLTARYPKWPGVVHDKAGSNMLGGLVLPANSPVHRNATVGTERTRDNLHLIGPDRAEEQRPYMPVRDDGWEAAWRRLDRLEATQNALAGALAGLRRALVAYVQPTLQNGARNPFAE